LTCYFRHLGSVFLKADIIVSKENKKEVDRIVRQLVGADATMACPVVWKQIKAKLAENEAGFIDELKTAWANRKAV
jgi:hypothetical protein